MTLAQRLDDLITRIGTEFKAIRVLIGGAGTSDVAALQTTATNIVAAINEVRALANSASSSGGLSEAEVQALIDTAVNNIIGGAPAALDTLNEIAAAIADDANYAASITSQLSTKAAIADVYTKAEIGNPDTDLVALFNTSLT
jgi:hypothetical protein